MFRTPIFRAEGGGLRAEGRGNGVPAGLPAPSALGPPPSGEAGFTLAGLLVILTIIAIFVAYTVPKQWSAVMARERDQQTLFAMKQYARAIRAYQEKNKSLPVSLDQLKQARQPRLMRGKGELIDPLTGKVDWVPVPASAAQNQGSNPNQQLPPGVIPPGGGGTATAPISGSGPGMSPTTMNPGGAGTQPQPGSPGGAVGPMIGVRSPKTGPSYLTVNGADSYEQWMYTTADLENEINMRRNAIMVK